MKKNKTIKEKAQRNDEPCVSIVSEPFESSEMQTDKTNIPFGRKT